VIFVVVVIITFIVQPQVVKSTPSPVWAKESCKLALEAMKCFPVVIYAIAPPLEVPVPRTAPVFVKSSRRPVFVSNYDFTALGDRPRVWHQQVAVTIAIPIRFGDISLRI
jgi:hypothetical protein